jgi:hypothetical protein
MERERERYGSGLFQSFAEKVRKIRVFDEVNMCTSGLKFLGPEVLKE